MVNSEVKLIQRAKNVEREREREIIEIILTFSISKSKRQFISYHISNLITLIKPYSISSSSIAMSTVGTGTQEMPGYDWNLP